MGLEDLANSIFERASILLKIKSDFCGPFSAISLYPVVDGEGWSISIFSGKDGKADEVRVEAPGFNRSLYRDGKWMELWKDTHKGASSVLAQADKEISDAIPLYMTLIYAYERFGELAGEGRFWQNVLLRWAGDAIHFNGQIGYDVQACYYLRNHISKGAHRRGVDISFGKRVIHADLSSFRLEGGTMEELSDVAKNLQRMPDNIYTQFNNYQSMKAALHRLDFGRLVPLLERKYTDVSAQFRAGPMKTA